MRKPTVAPIIADEIMPVSVLNAADIYSRETPMEKATEDASPSIPSVRFARAVHAKKGKKLALLHAKADIIHRKDLTKRLGKSANFNDILHKNLVFSIPFWG